MSINPPGGVSWLWALVYIAVGMYVIPLVLGMISRKRTASADKAG